MPHYRAAPGVMSEQVNDRTLLIDAASSELITLNPVGSIVWKAMGAGPAPFDQLVAAVSARYEDAAVDRVTDDVRAFLDELAEAGLVEVS